MSGPAIRPTQEVLDVSRSVRRWTETDELDAALHDIVYTCCRLVPCHSAAVALTTSVPGRHPVQVRAASDPDEFAILLDVVSRVENSPGVMAAATLSTVTSHDLTADAGSPLARFAALTVERTAVRATTAFALHLRGRLVGVLNLYFDRPQIPPEAADRAAALADHIALVIGERETSQRAENLEVALRTSRTIGAAIGILVERHRLTDAAAFELLRAASQTTHRKLRDVADLLVTTGTLDG